MGEEVKRFKAVIFDVPIAPEVVDCASASDHDRLVSSLREEVERLTNALVSARSNLRRIHEEAQNCDDDDALDALDYIIGWAQGADDAATKAMEKPE